MLLAILNGKKLLKIFTRKNCKKQIKENLELKKYSREKAMNYMLNGNDAIVGLIAG